MAKMGHIMHDICTLAYESDMQMSNRYICVTNDMFICLINFFMTFKKMRGRENKRKKIVPVNLKN